jgi:hypothetical protein
VSQRGKQENNKSICMKNNQKSAAEINIEVGKIHKEIQPALYEFNPKSKEIFEKTKVPPKKKIKK